MSYMSLSGADYFENIGRYRDDAENQLSMYRQNSLEQLQASSGKVQKQIEEVQKAGAGITALGMATKTLSKKLPTSMFKGVDTVGETGQKSISGFLENSNNYNPFQKSFSKQVSDSVGHNGDRLVGDGLDNSQAGRPLYSGRDAPTTPSKNLTKDVPPDSQLKATNDRINKMDNDDPFQDPAPKPAPSRETAGLEDNTEVSLGGRGRTVETDLPQLDTSVSPSTIVREPEIDNSAIDDGGRASRRAGLDELDPTGNPSPYAPKKPEEAPSEIEPAPQGTEPQAPQAPQAPKGTQEETFENQASLDAEGGVEGTLNSMKNDLPALVSEEGGLGGAELLGVAAGGGELLGAGLLIGGLAYEMLKSKDTRNKTEQIENSIPPGGGSGGGGGANIADLSPIGGGRGGIT